MKLDGGRQCHSAGVCLKEIVGLEGVELGADGKVGILQFLRSCVVREKMA